MERGQVDRFVQSSVVEVIVRDRDGRVKSRSFSKNLRVAGGADFWSAQLFSQSPGNVGANRIALSTSPNFPNPADTVLGGQVSGSGLDVTQAQVSRNPGDAQTMLSCTWSYAGSVPITIARIGLFAGTTLILESLLASTATLTNPGDQITVNWQVGF